MYLFVVFFINCRLCPLLLVAFPEGEPMRKEGAGVQSERLRRAALSGRCLFKMIIAHVIFVSSRASLYDIVAYKFSSPM